MRGNLSERRGRQSGGVFSFSLLRRKEGNNARFIIANRRNEIRGKRRGGGGGGGGVGEKAAAFKFGLEFQHYHFIPRQLCSPQTAHPHPFRFSVGASQWELVIRAQFAGRSIRLSSILGVGGGGDAQPSLAGPRKQADTADYPCFLLRPRFIKTGPETCKDASGRIT